MTLRLMENIEARSTKSLAEAKPGGKVKLKDWNMADLFDKYIERILGHEGGYVNNPKDPGGETKWGISKRAYPNVDIKNLTREDAIAIYRKDHWVATQINLLPTGLSFQVLDAAINHGSKRAIQWLQQAVGTMQDGVIGPATLGNVKVWAGGDASRLILNYLSIRLQFYTDIGGWDTFGKGWARRTATNMRYAAAD